MGCRTYEMATGALPFREICRAMFYSLFNRNAVAASRLNPLVPERLQTIISKLLEKSRDACYQSAAEVCADLKRVQRDLGYGARPADATSSHHPSAVATGALGIARQIPLRFRAAGGNSRWGVFLYMKRARALTEKDTILLMTS